MDWCKEESFLSINIIFHYLLAIMRKASLCVSQVNLTVRKLIGTNVNIPEHFMERIQKSTILSVVELQ